MEKTTGDDLRRFYCLSNEIDAAYHEAAVRLGLSDSVLLILYILCGSGGGLLGDIVRLSGISKQTLSSALRRLEADNSIVTETLEGRKKQVRLTQSGRHFAEKTAGRLIQIEDEIFSSWSAADRNAYISLMQRYLSAFKEKAKKL